MGALRPEQAQSKRAIQSDKPDPVEIETLNRYLSKPTVSEIKTQTKTAFPSTDLRLFIDLLQPKSGPNTDFLKKPETHIDRSKKSESLQKRRAQYDSPAEIPMRNIIFSHEKRTNTQPKLAAQIQKSYTPKVDKDVFAATDISVENFLNSICAALQAANTPYAKRNNSGLYYASQYTGLYEPTVDWSTILGLTNAHYWRTDTHPKSFIARSGVKPSDALSAFFEGPSFPDCSSALQASILRAIEMMIGTNSFNTLFNDISPLLISSILFNPVLTEAERADLSLAQRLAFGNPLYFLFDPISPAQNKLTESDVKAGDILYIQGVEKCSEKHLCSFDNGWNVICVGKNESGENLYFGFSPNEFQKPLTYAQIKKMCIDGYNAPQDQSTLTTIHNAFVKFATKPDDNTRLNYKQAKRAEKLADDTVSQDEPIGGITNILRFNPEKLTLFLKQRQAAWYSIPQDQLLPLIQKSCQPTRLLCPIPAEDRGKIFGNYQPSNIQQTQMLQISQQFAHAVCSAARREPVALMLSGMPGVGKTHLSVAVADFVQQQGLSILYVDESILNQIYQKQCEAKGGFLEDSEKQALIESWLENIDLIVLDDLNTEYGIGAIFLQTALEYVTQHNKAFMMSSNNNLKLDKHLRDYVHLNNPLANNTLILNNLSAPSHRKPWYDQLTLSTETMQDPYKLMSVLANFSSGTPAGILIEMPMIDLASVKQDYLSRDPNNPRVRIVEEPYRYEVVHDYYVTDSSEYDVLIIQVNTYAEVKQLLKLISSVHNDGQKLIVVTEDQQAFQTLLQEELESVLNREVKPRLKDRLKNLLLVSGVCSPSPTLSAPGYGALYHSAPRDDISVETDEMTDKPCYHTVTARLD